MSNCGCNDPCKPTIPCSCEVRLNSDCITVSGSTLTCSGITDGQLLTETLNQLDTFICDKFNEVTGYTTLINVGEGVEVYKGISGIGNKEIRTITKEGDLIVLTQNTNDIEIALDEEQLITFIQENQKTYSLDNVGTGAGIYKDSAILLNNEQFNLRSITSIDESIEVVQGTNTIDLSVNFPIVEGIFIDEGDGISVSGLGTEVSPFVVTNTKPDQTVSITDSGIATVTGSYPNFNIDVPAPDGSETILNSGVTTTVSGTGTTGSPYTVEVENLQKSINVFPYTLLNTDDKYTIFINNLASNVVINVPDSLPDKYSVAFIQEGTGDVTFNPTGTAVIETAVGLKIKGQFYWVLLEKKENTITHYLVGSTKV